MILYYSQTAGGDRHFDFTLGSCQVVHLSFGLCALIGCFLQWILGVLVPSASCFSDERVTLRAWLWYLTAFLVSDTARST